MIPVIFTGILIITMRLNNLKKKKYYVLLINKSDPGLPIKQLSHKHASNILEVTRIFFGLGFISSFTIALP